MRDDVEWKLQLEVERPTRYLQTTQSYKEMSHKYNDMLYGNVFILCRVLPREMVQKKD